MNRLDRLGAECTKARPEFDPDEIGELCDHAQALAGALRAVERSHPGSFTQTLAAFDEWNEAQG